MLRLDYNISIEEHYSIVIKLRSVCNYYVFQTASTRSHKASISMRPKVRYKVQHTTTIAPQGPPTESTIVVNVAF